MKRSPCSIRWWKSVEILSVWETQSSPFQGRSTPIVVAPAWRVCSNSNGWKDHSAVLSPVVGSAGYTQKWLWGTLCSLEGVGQRSSQWLNCVPQWGGTVSHLQCLVSTPPPTCWAACLRVLLGLAAPGNGTGLRFSHPYWWFENMGNQNCGQSCWVRSLSRAVLQRPAMCRDGSIVQGCFLAPSCLVRGTEELCRAEFFRIHLPGRLLFRIKQESARLCGCLAGRWIWSLLWGQPMLSQKEDEVTIPSIHTDVDTIPSWRALPNPR